MWNTMVHPYQSFDDRLSKYYKENKAKIGLYAGSFFNYWKGDTDGITDGYWWCRNNYYNFKWGSNLANRKETSAAVQGIVCDTLSGGTYTGNLQQETENGGECDVPYFNTTLLNETHKY